MELGILESYGHIGCISRVLRCHFFWIIEYTIRKSNMATDIPPLDDFPDKKQHLLRMFTCHVWLRVGNSERSSSNFDPSMTPITQSEKESVFNPFHHGYADRMRNCMWCIYIQISYRNMWHISVLYLFVHKCPSILCNNCWGMLMIRSHSMFPCSCG